MFAAQLHREQRRKGSNVPYVSHLLAVAALVIEHGGDEDEAIAALLHDAIEAQGGAKALLRECDSTDSPSASSPLKFCLDPDQTGKLASDLAHT